MATLILAAAGAFIGAGFGGTVLGLSGAVIGRAIGATIGRAIDQRLIGGGSEAVEVGRLDRLRLMSAGEGGALPLIWGRMRIGGQVIWASGFTEHVTRTGGGGGKGRPPQPTVTSYSYSVSLAVALGEGVILGVGRVWADGSEVDASRLGMRVYPGTDSQLPDPKIAAAVGIDAAPAYRGTAYVVFEDLPLADYGNRVPQFTFEVIREAQGALADEVVPFARSIRAVAMIPGTGEYSLATRPVRLAEGFAAGRSVNQHSPTGRTDLVVSLEQLRREVPGCGSVSLVVSWFGDDLRCGQCRIRPKVEQKLQDGIGMPWRAGGIARDAAQEVPRIEGASLYGGTPADGAVIEAIAAIRAGGQEVMFYPFILMDQWGGNGRPDPWSGAASQPALPWRGRITLSVAPGRAGTPDRTAAAAAEVAAFFGAAQAAHFARLDGQVIYSGPSEDWGLRRFILHYAHLCVLAGGVEAFCIGSELRGLTEIRGAGDSFPAVQALRALAADVRGILGPGTKISYAADWTEYAGVARDGNRYFHLDPLWADANIDFVGIDNYMPLSDWRETEAQADADWPAIHDLAYLQGGIAGGEGFDWYYSAPEGEAAQRREPITDGDHEEPWIWRGKDLKSWWSLAHHERIDGERQALPTAWVPMAKPIRFTEYGCPAVDKGTNQPNLFFDARSSEAGLPRASTGQRDDLVQMQYYRAMAAYWSDPSANPLSPVYGGAMVDMARAHAWAWDARPYPAFPLRVDVWSDGPNYAHGHWLNGRVTAQPIEAVAAEIIGRGGLNGGEMGQLYGLVRGYALADVGTARAALQPLMLACGFDAMERDGDLALRSRSAQVDVVLDPAALVAREDGDLTQTRASEVDAAGRLRVSYLDAEGDYQRRIADVLRADADGRHVLDQDAPIVLLQDEARRLAERWLTEVRVGRDAAGFSLPPSALGVGVGDVVDLGGRRWRIDRAEQTEALSVEAVRVEPGVYLPGPDGGERGSMARFVAQGPVYPVFLDLPLLSGREVPHAPHLAVTATPWPGRVALWGAEGEDGFTLNSLLAAPCVIGESLTALPAARPGLWDRGPALRVRFEGGATASASLLAVLNGANLAAIGDGSVDRWEMFQFANAELVAPGVWELSMRLRGQAGTDGIQPAAWPVGSHVVLITPAVTQIDLPLAARGLARVWRVGAAQRGFDDPDVVARTLTFDSIGLRPYPVAHLRAEAFGANTRLAWLRRTRVDGDSWISPEVPLGEEREAYVLRVLRDGGVLRTLTVTENSWIYPAALRAADGPGQFSVAVAQLSDRFGPGPFRSIDLP